ncbi:MAG: hypothetical protein CL666_08630 [Balneola sp.]|nr:hypothetical protein [Balneola sp.]|tara:strand:+ start:21558 stop:21860 length:303 start_codon:yes stop_codon:yes gene_type:complete
MTDIIATKSFNILAIVTAWIFAQAAEYGGIINQAFDQLFSLGLLVVVIVVLFREYKNSKEDNAELDQKFQVLLKENIETRKDFNSTIEALTNAIEKLGNK